jgi:hypothetical protein
MVIAMKKMLSTLFLCLLLNLTANELTWTSPTTLSTTGIDASSPHVDMDSSGNAVALWLEGSALISKNLPLSSSWSSANTLSATGASEPQLVVDSSGNATAIWTESGAIQTATQLFGSSWGSTTTLSASGSSAPQLAVSSSGEVVAVWVASGIVQANILPSPTGVWGASPATLSGSNSAAPQVEIAANGTPLATWQTLNGTTSLYNVYATSYTAGSWNTPSLVSNPTTNSVYPQIAGDSNGNTFAIWYSYDLSGNIYSNVILQASYQPSLGSWSTPIAVSAPGMRNPAELGSKLLLNQAGNALAVWTNDFTGNTFSIQTSGSINGSAWDTPVAIDTSIYSYSIDFAANSIGDALAVYMTLDPSSNSAVIQYIESQISGINEGFWTNPVLISSGTANSDPKISTQIVGATNCFGTTAWMSFNGSNSVIDASSGSGTLVIPPTNVTVSQASNNTGVFQEYYNTISWTASTDPNLVAYAIYRNGTFLTSVGSSQVSYIDQNQELNGSVTYGVSALNNVGTESPIITVVFP